MFRYTVPVDDKAHEFAPSGPPCRAMTPGLTGCSGTCGSCATMADYPDEVVQRAAEVMLRQYETQYDAAHLTWRDFAASAREVLDAAFPVAEIVTEHAQLMSGGGFHVRNGAPEIEKVYPLREWIRYGQRDGGQVYRRKVIVVRDWAKVPRRKARDDG
jgi:hypothetical protein